MMADKQQAQLEHTDESFEEKISVANKDWFKVDTHGLAVQMQELGTARLDRKSVV